MLQEPLNTVAVTISVHLTQLFFGRYQTHPCLNTRTLLIISHTPAFHAPLQTLLLRL